MLNQAIGGVLPAAVGVALSPVPVIAVILMLATPRGRTNGLAFGIGWIAGLVVVAIVVLGAAGSADTSTTTNDAIGWGKVALGVVFFAMAARQWRSRPHDGDEAAMPSWMATIDQFTAVKALAFGALLSGVNPKNLALTAAAAASIAQAGLNGPGSAAAIAIFVVIASITVVGPVLLTLVAPTTAARQLSTIKAFLSEHNAVIMMVVLLVLGAKLIGDGFAGL